MYFKFLQRRVAAKDSASAEDDIVRCCLSKRRYSSPQGEEYCCLAMNHSGCFRAEAEMFSLSMIGGSRTIIIKKGDMAKMSTANVLLAAGIILMAAAIISAAVAAVVFHSSGIRLKQQLQEEYGKKRR